MRIPHTTPHGNGCSNCNTQKPHPRVLMTVPIRHSKMWNFRLRSEHSVKRSVTNFPSRRIYWKIVSQSAICVVQCSDSSRYSLHSTVGTLSDCVYLNLYRVCRMRVGRVINKSIQRSLSENTRSDLTEATISRSLVCVHRAVCMNRMDADRRYVRCIPIFWRSSCSFVCISVRLIYWVWFAHFYVTFEIWLTYDSHA